MKKLIAALLCCALLFTPASAAYVYQAEFYSAGAGRSVKTSFEINDLWAQRPSVLFSRSLARSCAALAAAAYDAGSVSETLADMGYEIAAQRNYDRTATEQSHDFVAWTLGKRTLSAKGEVKNLYILVIRGTHDSGEWYGNFDVGQGIEHAGFKAAADALLLELGLYITTPSEQNSILVTGHSRGAAVANLAAQRLTDEARYAAPESVYGYTYACPATTTQPKSTGNIFNFNNPGDIATAMPLPAWGYGRNGQTITLATDRRTVRRLNASLRSLTGAEYTAGFDTQQFETVFSNWCPTVKQFYSGDDGSIHALFASLVPLMDGAVPENAPQLIARAAALGGMDALSYMMDASKALVQCHASETYIAWLGAMYG